MRKVCVLCKTITDIQNYADDIYIYRGCFIHLIRKLFEVPFKYTNIPESYLNLNDNTFISNKQTENVINHR